MVTAYSETEKAFALDIPSSENWTFFKEPPLKKYSKSIPVTGPHIF
jgi:hypothetical protein